MKTLLKVLIEKIKELKMFHIVFKAKILQLKIYLQINQTLEHINLF